MTIRYAAIFCAFACLISFCTESYASAPTAAQPGAPDHPGGPDHPVFLTKYRSDPAQTVGWTEDDLDFFMNGTMSTEVIPENVLKAFMKIYPDLYPRTGLSAFGIITNSTDGPNDLPIGFSRRNVPHLAGLSSLGVNCASCHVGEIIPPGGSPARRVLGMTSHFDPMSFIGAVIVATFRTSDPANMKKFLLAYSRAADPAGGNGTSRLLRSALRKQSAKLSQAVKSDPMGSNGVAAGELHDIEPADLALDRASVKKGIDLARTSTAFLKLFHNMRAALHVPDAIPTTVPPPPGPGRNDAFSLLSAVLFGEIITPANVKFGLVWNIKNRAWVHWDGNNNNPLLRNMSAALGLGGPLIGNVGRIDMAAIRRQTDLSESIRPPQYPWMIDNVAARRGRAHYEAKCASCHDVAESKRLHDPAIIGTDPNRSLQIDAKQAALYDKLFRRLQIPGYTYDGPPFRATGRYWASDLAGVWARSPYLHNGSVRTMRELLSAPGHRSATFRRGSKKYDAIRMGYADMGSYLHDTRNATDSNAGHAYGSELSDAEKIDLMEFLKTK